MKRPHISGQNRALCSIHIFTWNCALVWSVLETLPASTAKKKKVPGLHGKKINAPGLHSKKDMFPQPRRFGGGQVCAEPEPPQLKKAPGPRSKKECAQPPQKKKEKKKEEHTRAASAAKNAPLVGHCHANRTVARKILIFPRRLALRRGASLHFH